MICPESLENGIRMAKSVGRRSSREDLIGVFRLYDSCIEGDRYIWNGRTPTFPIISDIIQSRINMRLLRRRLAHIKYIPPEAVRIDNVSADDERKRSVLKIGLLFNVVVGHGGDSVFVALRILFDPRLREFHAAHPEYLKSRVIPATAQDESLPSNRQNLESYLDPQPLTPPERYPVPTAALESEEDATFMHYGFQSIEDNKEFLVVTQNSLDILSSILNSETEPKPIKDELRVSMLEKCKQSLPVVQRIIETTSDDEVMLFDALNLIDELQLVISRYTEMAAALESGHQTNQKEEEPARDNISNETTVPIQRESDSKTETPVNITTESTKSGKPSYQDQSGDKMS